MIYQRIKCGGCDDCEHKVSCEECVKLLPPTAFYTYWHTVSYIKKCILCYNAKVESNCGKFVNRTNLNKHFKSVSEK